MDKKYLGHIQIPLQRVHLELTNICEFNCRFCPKNEMTRTYGHIDTDLAKRAITEISNLFPYTLLRVRTEKGV